MQLQLNEQQKQYLKAGAFVIVALILGFFGIVFPTQPQIPSPLPTPTPVDMSGVVSYEDLALLQRQVETMGATQGESFSVSGDSSYGTACYMMQGGTTWVAGDGCAWGVLSGGELEIQSGGTLDVQAGATVNLPTASLGNTTITGTLAVSGTTDLVGAVSSSTGGLSITDDLVVGVDGTSYDVTFYSDTAGDYFLWDQSEEALTIIGTNAADALNVDDGNVDIADDLDVDGTTYLDDLSVDGNISSAAGVVTITDALNVGVDGTSYDVTFYSDTAGDLLRWEQANEALVITGTNGQVALSVPDGNVDFVDALDVDGAVTFNSTLDVDGAISSGTGAITISDNLDVSGASQFGGAMNVDANGDFDSLSTLAIDSDSYGDSTGSVQINDDALITGTLAVAGNTTLTGTLTLESVAFSGPIRFGSASSVISGTLIAHGLAITPTAVMLMPAYVGVFTNTVYVLASNATSLTVGIGYTTGITTVTTLYWWAGK